MRSGIGAVRACASGRSRSRRCSSHRPSPPSVFIAFAIATKCSKNFERDVRVRAARPSRARAPSRASSCSRTPSTRWRRPARAGRPPGSGCERSKTPTLSSPRKPPVKRLSPSASSRLTHHVKLIEALVERALEELAVVAVARLAGELVDAPHRPRVHRRVDVAERELVRGQLPVRVHVPLAAQEQQLLLRELRDRSAPSPRSGTRGPTPRTTGTPTCRASRSRRAPTGAPSRGCGRACAPSGGGGCAGSPSSQCSTM